MYIKNLNDQGRLYLPDESTLILVADNKLPVTVRLYNQDTKELIVEEIFHPDNNLEISLDFKEVLEGMLKTILPNDLDTAIEQKELEMNLWLISADGDLSFYFVARNIRSSYRTKMTDIDLLRVPCDYIQPISAPGGMYGCSIELRNPFGNLVEEIPKAIPASPLIRTIFHRISSLPGTIRSVVVDPDGKEIVKSPILNVCQGSFEQYLFANKYGGFDNIPMDGVLTFTAHHQFKTLKSPSTGKTIPIGNNVDKEYTQHSGNLTRVCVNVLCDLLTSRQIYHLVNEEWKQIVITQCSVSHKSTESLHSITFSYKYCKQS